MASTRILRLSIQGAVDGRGFAIECNRQVRHGDHIKDPARTTDSGMKELLRRI